jgi:hypothetical protein
MQLSRYWHEQRGLWGMLVAHWLYWIGGILVFAFELVDERAKAASGTVKSRRDTHSNVMIIMSRTNSFSTAPSQTISRDNSVVSQTPTARSASAVRVTAESTVV